MFEDFFQVVFGTEVPAYQRFSQDTRNELDERARNISLISPEDSDEAGEAQQYILDKKALNNVKPFLFDMYKIVDGNFMPSLTLANMPVSFDFRKNKEFADAESWWEYVQNYYLPTVSIVKQGISPKTHWIWTYAGTSVLVEGQDAYIITPEEMQNQIYLDMVGSKIECYLSIVPIINFLARNQLFSKLLFRTN
jgi:hypothetical protein|tara:strand:- start:2119 stop:2700 length:582 start_codon:yes stop_codon:yes gene_type:complete